MTDRYDNQILTPGSCYYKVMDLSKYGVTSSVSESQSSESIYVYYSYGIERVAVRFSLHMNNAVQFGDQLDGNTATEIEVLHRLGLAKRTFIPLVRKWISKESVSKKVAKTLPECQLTLKELYELPVGTDISMYRGMVVKNTTFRLCADTVQEVAETRINSFGDAVAIGDYKYEMK